MSRLTTGWVEWGRSRSASGGWRWCIEFSKARAGILQQYFSDAQTAPSSMLLKTSNWLSLKLLYESERWPAFCEGREVRPELLLMIPTYGSLRYGWCYRDAFMATCHTLGSMPWLRGCLGLRQRIHSCETTELVALYYCFASRGRWLKLYLIINIYWTP